MSGDLILPPVEPEHRCRPPGDAFPPWWAEFPVGTIFVCECGTSWVVRWLDAHDFGDRRLMGHAEWFRESRREERRRFGIRWWQWWLK